MNGALIPFDGALASTQGLGRLDPEGSQMRFQVNVQIKIDLAKCLWALAGLIALL